MAHVGQKRAWSESRDDDLLSQLHNGVEGSTVLASLVQKNGKAYSLASLSTVVSNLRSQFMKTGHNSIDCYMSSLALRKFMGVEEAVADFFGATLDKQVDAQRGDTPGWSEGARDALKVLRLLPSNLETFRLNEGQNMGLKRNSAAALERKISKVMVVTTTDILLDEARDVLETANDRTASMPPLIEALLLVSGRRTAEITNGHSTFTEVLGQDYHARFTGQAKTRGKAVPYIIPLLVPYTAFINGVVALQAMQRHEKLPNKKAKDKYQSLVSDALSKPVLTNLPRGLKPHGLRSIYAAIVVSVFAHQVAIPRVVERVLGHSSAVESLNYSSVRLDPLPTMSLGDLPVYD